GGATERIDDDAVGRLVREVATGWIMPPVRLDQPGWRERVRGSSRAGRVTGPGGWFGRAGQALTGALVLTVAAALLAVYLTSPRAGVGKPGDSTAPTTGQPCHASTAPARP